MRSSTLIIRTYAFLWLVLSLGALVWLAWQFLSSGQTDSAQLGLELAALIIGLPAIIIGSLALVILKAKTVSLRRAAIVAVAVIPSLLLIGRPVIGGIILLAMVVALYATRNAASSTNPHS